MAQQNNVQNNSIISDEMWFAVFIILVIVAFWWVLHGPITILFFGIWMVEMKVIGFFTENLSLIENWVHEASPMQVKFSQFVEVSKHVGHYTRWFWIPIMAFVAFRIMMKNPTDQFKKTYTLESLKNYMGRIWPHAAIFYTKDTAKVGKVGYGVESALKNREFCKRFDLLDEEGELDEVKAEAEFINQLGPLFQGYDIWLRSKANNYKVAVMALFFLKFHREDDAFKKLRDSLAIAFNKSGKIDAAMPLAIEAFKKHKDSAFAKKLAKRHAYEYTLMHSAFKQAKRGVFAPNEFRWIKLYKRVLWYVLNSVDRRVAWIEAAGPKAHWLAEMAHGNRIQQPMVTEAIVGLKEALMEIVEKRDQED